MCLLDQKEKEELLNKIMEVIKEMEFEYNDQPFPWEGPGDVDFKTAREKIKEVILKTDK